MPYYDTSSLISEKQCIVLDLGYRYTKFGFGGEASPHCIIRTEVASSDRNSKKVRRVFDYTDEDDLRSLLIDFIHALFFRWALVSPKEKRLIVVESLLCPSHVRAVLTSVLFDHFEVSSVLFLPSHCVALYTLGVDTGLVIDIGQKETVIIPVYKGVPILRAWQTSPAGSNAVERNLFELLRSKGKLYKENGAAVSFDDADSVLTNFVLEDIKVKGCFVACAERAQLLSKGDVADPVPAGFTYNIQADKTIAVEPADRELPYEVLFEPDEDGTCLPTMVLDSLLACSIDMRKELSENIALIGGTSMAVGLKARLKQELLRLVKSDRYSEKVHVKTFKFHSFPGKENYVAWLGGSICGGTDAVMQKSFSKELYASANNCVPDWCDLRFHQLHIR